MTKSPKETIEFFVPNEKYTLQDYIDANDTSATHHIARYLWAKEILPSSGKVLDIACGAGYGTSMLAQSNPKLDVIGIDYDQRAVDYARANYKSSNLQFFDGDIVEWKYNDGKPLKDLGEFDVIVCFDTIEHLRHREIALINLSHFLSPTGMLLFSTPAGHKSPRLNPDWEHHKIEYSPNILLNLMKRFFGKVLYPLNDSLPNIEFWDELNRTRSIYPKLANPLVCSLPIKYDI